MYILAKGIECIDNIEIDILKSKKADNGHRYIKKDICWIQAWK